MKFTTHSHRHHRRVAGAALALVFFLFAGIARSEITVELELDPLKIKPGEQAELIITVMGAPNEATVIKPVLTGIDESIRHTFVTSSTSFGEAPLFLEKRSALYRITGDVDGTFTIPPQTVEVDGLLYKTNGAEFTVDDPDGKVEPPPARDPLITLNFSKSTLYAGEVVPVTVSLLVHKDTRLLSPGRVELPRDDFVVKRFPLEPRSSAIVNDDGSLVYTYTTAVSAIRPGKFTIGPASLNCIIDFPVERTIGRGMSAFRFSEPRRFALESDPLEIDVKPLPENPPPGFQDAVGRFVIHVNANPLELTVGDPISLEVEITGSGNLDTLTMPELESEDGWKLYESRKHGVPDASGLEPTTTSFTQVAVPNRVHDSIPPLRFVYFDPEIGEYQTETSDPIPVTISPAAVTTAPAVADSPLDANPPEAALEDIVTPFSFPTPQISPLATSSLFHNQSFWLYQLVPLLFALGLLSIHLKRWNENRTPRKKTLSPKRMLNELETASTMKARRFYRIAGSVVDSWVVRRGSSANLTPELTQIVERQHALCYTAPGDGGEVPVPPPERERVIATLKSLKF